MNLKRLFIALLFLSVSLLTFGQTIDMLQLKNSKLYCEENLFKSDSVLTIVSRICFDIPKMDDEEYCQRVYFKIKNFKSGSILNLEDTLTVKTNYTKIGTWLIENRSKFKGIIKIISVTKEEIELDMDFINFVDQKKYVYKGVRSFKKSKKKL
jgi:hypothetical protein